MLVSFVHRIVLILPQKCIPGLVQLSAAADGPQLCKGLLEYLVKGEQVKHLVGLPLLPSTKSGYVVLEQGNPRYLILGDTETSLFEPSGCSFVRAGDLPAPLRTRFTDGYSVYLPSAGHIADLAALCVPGAKGPEAKGLIFPGNTTFSWLQRFWAWIADLPTDRRQAICQELTPLRLLPTSSGALASPYSVYSHSTEVSNARLLSLLQKCGLEFLSVEFSAQGLEQLGVLQNVADIASLIIRLASQVPVLSAAKDDDLHALCQMLVSLLDGQPCLSAPCRAKLRTLPIFPVLHPSTNTSGSRYGPISNGSKVFLVPRNVPLPAISDKTYVDGDDVVGRALAQACEPGITPRSETQILELALSHFLSQSFLLQVSIAEHLKARAQALPRNLVERLKQHRFIPTSNSRSSMLAYPSDVLDPESQIARDLAGALGCRTPRTSTPDQCRLIACLSALGLLIDSLTPTIAKECIIHIVSSPDGLAERFQLSFKLMGMMNRAPANFAFREIAEVANKEWIACEGDKLHRASDCCDDGVSYRARALFDRVLGVACARITCLPLRSVLGWNSPLPFRILKCQLQKVLEGDVTMQDMNSLHALLKELGGRAATDLNEANIIALRSAVGERPWIPVGNRLVKTAHAVLQKTVAEPFLSIASLGSDVQKFLVLMGCSER
jgi:hypothetical protein